MIAISTPVASLLSTMSCPTRSWNNFVLNYFTQVMNINSSALLEISGVFNL